MSVAVDESALHNAGHASSLTFTLAPLALDMATRGCHFPKCVFSSLIVRKR